MSRTRRSVMTMAAYLLGLVVIFGAALVFLTGIGESDHQQAPTVPGQTAP